MLVGSHYRIGSFVYHNIITKYIPFSSIDKKLFQAGNIYPGFSKKLSKLEHTLEGSSKPYQHYIRKAQDGSLSSEERMVSMGVMWHYLTDFFCIYHSKEPFMNQSILRHLFYEFMLHLILQSMALFSKKLYRQILAEEARSFDPRSTEALPVDTIADAAVDKAANLDTVADAAADTTDLQLLLFSLQREYHAQKSTIKTDIRFALKATLFSTTLLMKEFTVKAPVSLAFNAAPSFGRLTSSLSSNLAPLAVQPRHLQKQLPTL